jgi:hypothetical protein
VLREGKRGEARVRRGEGEESHQQTDRDVDQAVDGVSEDDGDDDVEKMHSGDRVIFSCLARGVAVRELPSHLDRERDPKDLVHNLEFHCDPNGGVSRGGLQSGGVVRRRFWRRELKSLSPTVEGDIESFGQLPVFDEQSWRKEGDRGGGS